MPLNECDEQLVVNEYVKMMMEMSVEDIKNLEKYEQIAELYKDISRPKVNTTQSLQSIWEESLRQPTAMPKELINDFQGISGTISKGQS